MSAAHSNKAVVGISSRSSEKDLRWLMELIRRTFWDLVSEVKYLPITNSNALQWEQNLRRCTVGILYHTKHQGRLNIVDVDGALYNEELKSLYDILGRSKVLVVLDDLENCSESEKQRILKAQPNLQRLSSQLLLFPEGSKEVEVYEKKEELRKFLGGSAPSQVLQVNTPKSKGSSFLSSISSFFGSDNSHPEDNAKANPDIRSRPRICIFSRSAPNNYGWLMEKLKATFEARAAEVCAVQITNYLTTFYSELQNCSFAILYHTKKQGRVNITDVTDSLYNDELKELFKCLGQTNVIVVIDDLQNISSAEKNRILGTQPSIGRLARDLFLFSEEKRTRDDTKNLEDIKQIIWRTTQNYEPMDTDSSQQWKSDNSSKSERPQAHNQDRNYKSTASGSSSTARSKEQDVSRTCRDPNESGEPESKRCLLDCSKLSPNSAKAAAEMDSALQDVLSKWQVYQCMKEQEIQGLKTESEGLLRQKGQRLEESSKTIQEKLNKIEKLQKDLHDRDRTIQEKQHTIERLQKDLHDRDRTIEENCETIQKMGQKIQELQKTPRNKELQGNEGQRRTQTQLRIEKRQKDLCDKDRTMEKKDDDTIQRMEQKIQELKNCLHELENKSKQEQAGQNRREGKEAGESQRYRDGQNGGEWKEARESQQYGEESLVSGENKTPCQHRSGSGAMKPELSPYDIRSQDTMYDHCPNPTEMQTSTLASNLIEQLKHITEQLKHEIQKKDEEICRLKSDLVSSAALVHEILSGYGNGKAPS